MIYRISPLLGLLLCIGTILCAQNSDNGNGTFTNPVLWSDFPDPDAIRVDDTYYMVSTSMHYFPGVTVLASKDLVNWEIASNAVPEFKEHPFYDMNGGNRYAGGQWASSIRYFKGKFYVLFNTNAEGAYMCIAESATGPWELKKLNMSLYDPGLFVDSDGRMYVVHGHTQIYVTELDPNTLTIKEPMRLVYTGTKSGLEGNHCYKINNQYYIFCTYGTAQGSQICLRANHIYGPYVEKEVLNDDANLYNMYLHQGCLIDTPNGNYWSLIFQDRVGLGRIPFLLPVTFIDNWPMLAVDNKGLVTFDKPVNNAPKLNFPTSDNFDSSILGKQWQFNHNPDKTKFSLTQRAGHIRMYTATITNDLRQARNTLCQRIFGPQSTGTIKIDISSLIAGDVAGLVVMQDPFASICVEKQSTGNVLQMRYRNEVKASVSLSGHQNILYLQAQVNGLSDRVRFYYSFDDIDYHRLGEEFKMAFSLSDFCGNRYGVFTYATQGLGGYIDVDWIRVAPKTTPINYHLASDTIEAERYDNLVHGEVASSYERESEGNQEMVFSKSGWMSYNLIKFNNKDYKSFVVRFMSRESGCKLMLRKNDEMGELIADYDLPRSPVRKTLEFPIDSDKLQNIDKLYVVLEKSGTQSLIIDWFTFTDVHSFSPSIPKDPNWRCVIKNDLFYILGGKEYECWNIYSLSGILLKHILGSNPVVSIADLPRGCYFVQDNYGKSKTIIY